MSQMSQAVPGMRRFGGKRKYTESTAATIIQRAVKRAKKAPAYKSKFALRTVNNKSILPNRLRQTLCYTQTLNLSTPSTSGLVVRNAFRMNGMFDPDATGSGHQPMGYDQLSAIYVRWFVIGCKVTIHCLASDATYYTGKFGINVRDPSGSPPIDDNSAIESMYSTYNVYTQAGGPTKCTLGLDVAKYFGVKDLGDDNELQGSALADPGRQVLCDVWASSDQNVAKPVVVTVKIDYDCMFVEPKNISGS